MCCIPTHRLISFIYSTFRCPQLFWNCDMPKDVDCVISLTGDVAAMPFFYLASKHLRYHLHLIVGLAGTVHQQQLLKMELVHVLVCWWTWSDQQEISNLKQTLKWQGREHDWTIMMWRKRWDCMRNTLIYLVYVICYRCCSFWIVGQPVWKVQYIVAFLEDIYWDRMGGCYLYYRILSSKWIHSNRMH